MYKFWCQGRSVYFKNESFLRKKFVSQANLTNKNKSVRIGCASGFWGDTSTAAPQLVRKGNINYLVFDYLSEITMSLLVRAKQKNPEYGYCPDFIQHSIGPLLPEIKEKGIKVISNAGGINPLSCAKVLQSLCKQQNIELNIAVITGDDLMPRLKEIKEELVNQLPKGIHSMNAYLGAGPIARALDLGADVVITGRCVDSAVTLAPLIHTFNWKSYDYDLLAAGSLAGHLIECGAQVTGGIFTDWESVHGWDDIGFPIVECYSNGEFIVTKPHSTGGLISKATVSEQIVYEIGDPDNYMLPDVTCSFSQAKLSVVSRDDPAVMVKNVYGKPPSVDYKVSATFMDGFRATAVCPVVGPNSSVKGERVADAIIKSVIVLELVSVLCRRMFQENGFEDFSKINVELLGTEGKYQFSREPVNKRDVVLWLAVQHKQKEALEIFAREIAPAGTGMAPGLTAIVGGRPTVAPVLKLYSFQYPKEKVEIFIHLNGVMVEKYRDCTEKYREYNQKVDRVEILTQECVNIANSKKNQHSGVCTLGTLAYTRSGDKGNDANIGVICREKEYYNCIKDIVTAEAVEEYFKHFFEGTANKCRVKRYELPGIFAFNFVLEEVLGGGGVASLRSDPQGKGLGQMLLDFKVTLS
ncbi:uncharacterized protein LOC100209618 isoform X4 [Hydra vulgaris]|uniref:Uncharacterized protein LOC100209618 isoform X4 n=1 Tax=Hydra vulgaris TaxID=6087 RepID=A0ABM4D3Z8_HYDVU